MWFTRFVSFEGWETVVRTQQITWKLSLGLIASITNKKSLVEDEARKEFQEEKTKILCSRNLSGKAEDRYEGLGMGEQGSWSTLVRHFKTYYRLTPTRYAHQVVRFKDETGWLQVAARWGHCGLSRRSSKPSHQISDGIRCWYGHCARDEQSRAPGMNRTRMSSDIGFYVYFSQ